ncbi:unnamed protein product, partial [Mycena citricolor]
TPRFRPRVGKIQARNHGRCFNSLSCLGVGCSASQDGNSDIGALGFRPSPETWSWGSGATTSAVVRRDGYHRESSALPCARCKALLIWNSHSLPDSCHLYWTRLDHKDRSRFLRTAVRAKAYYTGFDSVPELMMDGEAARCVEFYVQHRRYIGQSLGS